MCGIFAAVGSGPTTVERVLAALRHRGPDACGVEQAGPVTLVHTRLRIIDLSEAADQPLRNEDGTILVLYNGELYNWRQLREDMETRGHSMASDSDGEVLPHLYEEYGPGMLDRLRGMFALVVWDGRTNTLLAARDRLGMKPLYYVRKGQGLQLASELGALVASGALSLQASLDGVASYLAMGSVIGPATIFPDAMELQPAHTLAWRDGRIELHRYWSPPETTRPIGDLDAAGRLRDALQDSVDRHLLADRPVGIFLSGGVDSGTVASLAARSRSGVTGLTVTFPEAPHEGEFASETARALGIKHQVIEVSGPEIARSLPDALAAMDQPTSDGLNTWIVSRAARESGLVVALSGLGGDELFHGYPSFRLVPRMLAWMRAGRAIPRKALLALATKRSSKHPDDRLARTLEVRAAGASVSEAYRAVRGLFPRSFLERLTAGELRTAIRGFALPQLELDGRDPRRSIALLELGCYMRNQLLRDTDQMSMAHSLEVRVPLLDDEVVNLALSVPSEVIERSGPKSLLLRSVKDILPPHLAGQAKRGFTLPFEKWLGGPLKPALREGLLSEQLPLADLLDVEARRTLLRSFEAGRVHWSRPWAVAALRLWLARSAESS